MNHGTTKRYHDIGMNLLPAIAYGDAVGLPYETSPPLQPGEVQGLQQIANDYLGEHPIGTWSDDTQLSLAVTESLLDKDGFDLEDQAQKHVDALRHSLGEVAATGWRPAMVSSEKVLGWGGSTEQSVRRIMAGIHPLASGETQGAGNGVLMKLAPLAYWQQARGVDIGTAATEVLDLTRMTHQAPEAIVSSLVHVNVLKDLMDIDPAAHPHIPAVKRSLIGRAAMLASQFELQLDTQPTTSTMLQQLVELMHHNELTPQTIAKLAPRQGFYAPETLAMAYGSFVLESTFPKSVYRAVELGGDTDSVGSIVASMSVMLDGTVEMPTDIGKLYDIQRLQNVSMRLVDWALRSRFTMLD